MPEVQKTSLSGEMTQRFIEFLMMTAQQAAMFLGKIPNPQTGRAEVNIDIAKLFIDQLEMIREKTKGNLSREETEILSNILADLQFAFIQASGGTVAAETAEEAPEQIAEPEAAPEVAPAPEAPAAGPAAEVEGSRKKFSKSYGG